jgi:hypothetical protein
METYTFWYVTKWGYFNEQTGLTKRQAVIRFNKLQKNYDPKMQSFGWELEKKPAYLNKLMEEYVQV